MRVMVTVKGSTAWQAGASPDEACLGAMVRYNEELVKAGVLLHGEGLHPSARGARVLFSGGARTVVDGPFAESTALVAGYWLWQVRSLDEAIEWAKRCPDPTSGAEDSEIEIRPVFETEEFGSELMPETRDRDERLPEKLAAG